MELKNLLRVILAVTFLSSMSMREAAAEEMQCEFLSKEIQCKSNLDCKQEGCQAYCSFPQGSCGEDEELGSCKAMPEMCTMQYQAVCGCDGKTYSNACKAAAAGVSLRSEEACPK